MSVFPIVKLVGKATLSHVNDAIWAERSKVKCEARATPVLFSENPIGMPVGRSSLRSLISERTLITDACLTGANLKNAELNGSLVTDADLIASIGDFKFMKRNNDETQCRERNMEMVNRQAEEAKERKRCEKKTY